MSSRLDERIHSMMQQVVNEAPLPPTLPATPVTSTHRPVPNWAIAVAVAVITLVAVGTVSVLLGGSDGSIVPSGPPDTEPAANTSTTAAVVANTPAETTLVPIEGFEPVAMSTPIGDFEFVTMGLPPGDEFDFPFHTTVVTPQGPVALDESLWWSSDYLTWNHIAIDGDYGDIGLLDDDLMVITNAVASRFVWDGSRWVQEAILDLPDSVERIATGPRGIVAATPTSIFYSLDGVTFTEAEQGPDLERFAASQVDPDEEEYSEAAKTDCRGTFGATEARIRTVLATQAGFVAFTSATHATDEVCSPFVWFSSDGLTWEPVSDGSPFGAASVDALSIAEHDGRFVAIGGIEAEGRGFVWVSDDAIKWRLADLDLSSPHMTSPLMVDAGDLGWVLVGAGTGTDFALWFSPDGYTWDGPHALPEGLRVGWLVPEIVVGTDTIFGVGYREEVFVIGHLRPDPAQGD